MSLADLSETALDRVVAAKPGGERRDGQVAMVREVAEAIDEERHLVIEAGPGTGKSFGYLVPAIESGRKVVVATATKSLQDQLATKDLPFLAETLDREVSWAVVKGRQNYLCRSKLVERLEAEGVFAQQATLEGLDYDLPEDLQLLAEWADVHPTGDRDDLPDRLPEGLWESVSVSGMECPGRDDCPQGGNCFAMDALDRAAGADIVVVNHHLYGNDLAMDGALLPEHDLVVFDEAHKLEDSLSSSLGVELTEGRVWQVQRAADRFLKTHGGSTAPARALGEAARAVQRTLADARPGRVGGDQLGSAFSTLASKVGEVAKAVRDLEPTSPGGLGARARVLRLAGHLAGDAAWAVEAPEGYVSWIQRDGATSALEVAPIRVGSLLADHLLSRTPAIFTSATLSLAGSLESTVHRLGLDQVEHRAVRVASPFDFPAQAKVYVAARLPEPRSPDYLDRALSEIEHLVEAAGGRALVLTTSFRMLEAIAEHLRENIAYEVLAQGDLPKRRLVERFAGEETSVLVATMGFWEGLDIPGRALELVVVDKLPFPRPDDPLWQARREAAEKEGRSAFMTVDVPHAATLLAQGAGRLIRTVDDRGVIALLDSRLMKRRYGRVLLQSLPPIPVTTSRHTAEAFLRAIGAPSPSA